MKGTKFSFLFRTLTFLAAFFLVVYATLVINEYLGEFRLLYLLTGRWKDAILLSVFILGIGFILRELLMWQYRKSAGIKRRRRR